ncbi:hypothetical protein CDL15_Pgr002677 [Punica granatum]|uniref:Uncharacterized protein n=1 Tax=Punica granatum TaxID=22663 RepID=A0A218WW20_PUNGR|nr:hypothetical protein CDL15_Pgr002677 [Punica granatum]
MRKGRRSASAGTSCRPPSCLITRPGNMSVLPKWLRRGTPTIPGHPVIMGPPGFHRATHKKRASVNSRQKRLHSEKLCSGGGITDTSDLSVIEPSVDEVDHAVPEYTPSAFRGGSVRFLCSGGLCRGASRRPSEASLTKTTGKSA